MILTKPTSVRLDIISEQYPLRNAIKHYKKENMDYLLHVLYYRTLGQMFETKENRKKEEIWFSLLSKYLKAVVRNYQHYFDYMEKYGFLKRKNHIKGVHGRMYCLNLQLFNMDETVDFGVSEKMEEKIRNMYISMRAGFDPNNISHQHLICSAEAVTFDPKALIRYQPSDNDGRSIDKIRKDKLAFQVIRRINDRIFTLKRSKRNGRIYTPISTIPRRLRNLVRLGGKKIVGCDISNTGPLLLIKIIEDLQKNFACETNHCPLLAGLSVGNDRYRSAFNISKKYYMPVEEFNDRFKDFRKFTAIVSSGQLNSFILEKINEDIIKNPFRSAKSNTYIRTKPNEQYSMKPIKKAVLKYFNSGMSERHRWSELKLRVAEVMEAEFPNLVRLIDIYKNFPTKEFSLKDRHKYYAKVVLTMESRLMIEQVGKKLAEKNILWLPLHDCAFVQYDQYNEMILILFQTFHENGLSASFKTNLCKESVSYYLNENGIVYESGLDGKLQSIYYVYNPTEKVNYEPTNYILGTEKKDITYNDLKLINWHTQIAA